MVEGIKPESNGLPVTASRFALTNYIGRFAPSPTGPLHAGSLVAALGSWLDARAHGGQWLVRIEDVDGPRCPSGMTEHILAQLHACGLVPDAEPLYQSQRGALYQQALDRLIQQNLAYPCTCSRKTVAAAQGQMPPRHGELIYPGTCRHRMGQAAPAHAAWRFWVPDEVVTWHDRCLGEHTQNVQQMVGDFVLRRADGLWAYQLAVVVDDAVQGISHVVRGADLLDNTPRQIFLQRALGYSTPQYLHLPLVCNAQGEKLSKQTGAVGMDLNQALSALHEAGQFLGCPVQAGTVAAYLSAAVLWWGDQRTY